MSFGAHKTDGKIGQREKDKFTLVRTLETLLTAEWFHSYNYVTLLYLDAEESPSA